MHGGDVTSSLRYYLLDMALVQSSEANCFGLNRMHQPAVPSNDTIRISFNSFYVLSKLYTI